MTDRTRIILVNSPHNPTGAVLDADTLALVVGSPSGTTRSS